MENKKLTKKELEAIQKEKENARYYFIQAIQDYWKDKDAAERYYKTKGEIMPEEEVERLFRRYEVLNNYNIKYNKEDKNYRMWDAIRCMVRDYESKHDYRNPLDKHFTVKADKNDLIVDDIIWDIDQLQTLISEALKYGYERIFYMNNSSGAMETLGQLVELGGVLEGTVYNVEYDRFGLIFNIKNINLEDADKLIEDELVIEDMKKELGYLEDRITYNMYSRDVVAKLVLKYSKQFGLVKTYKTVTEIKNNLINIINKEKQDKEAK